jgi:hypothetical protein
MCHSCLASYMFGLIGVRSGIPSIRIDSGNYKQDAATKFRNDPSILVLLLHGCVHDHSKPNRANVLIKPKGTTECGAERDLRLPGFPPGERSPPFI